jgi:small subunit ribosomal protein S20
MATHKSALKEHRRAAARRLRHRQQRARLRTAVKKFRQAVAAGEVDAARGLLPETLALVDRSAKLNAIHTSAANRTKSRLTRALNRAASGA